MTTQDSIIVGNLKIASPLYQLIQSEIAPGTGIEPQNFWLSLSAIVEDLRPSNQTLLEKRDFIQRQIDRWHQENTYQASNLETYKNFLTQIGYLVPEGEPFQVNTVSVDREIGTVAGPQLVVPVDNARYALNAANARWGSLYDALYGTDVISEENGAEKGSSFNPVRGKQVVAYAKQFLDNVVPLNEGSYRDVTHFGLEEKEGQRQLIATLQNGKTTGLTNPSQFVGYQANSSTLQCIVLEHHDLHIEIHRDAQHPIGKMDPTRIKDVVLESAVTTIMDCEDSVSAVDAEDKVQVYRNWLGIMKGSLEADFQKGGQRKTRKMNADREFTRPDGQPGGLPGRSLLLIRNVGMHMLTDAVTTLDGLPIPEGFLDAMVTSLAALHDLHGPHQQGNSRAGNIYIVKPKQHGPEEVAFTVELFSRVEKALGIKHNTIKMGIMDEERRTTINLKECIRMAKERVIFINTGFLDRTGDEIHTLMEAGPALPKAEIKGCPWMQAYEQWNVDIGIECGLPGRAQIGKGMWAMPEAMHAMVENKIAHPQAGANTAWVPSPTAATLHAMHYHQIRVADRQKELSSRGRASLDDILTLPLLGNRTLTPQEIEKELENNAQGILGYVVRWVGQGVGCSKVPDIDDVGLMEDRATLRISSQHLANWLHHGIVTPEQVKGTFRKMAAVVDRQNSKDSEYQAMSLDFENSVEFQTALDLVFQGREEPNGYTEFLLHKRRAEKKKAS